MCPAITNMVHHVEPWEILSIDGMIFVSAAIFIIFFLLFGSCQIWHFVYHSDALGLGPPVRPPPPLRTLALSSTCYIHTPHNVLHTHPDSHFYC